MSNSPSEKSGLHCVVTTIQAPTECMRMLSEKWPGGEGSIIIVGDSKGPFEYQMGKSRLLDIETQRGSHWNLAKILPEKHYARKNLGYLHAMSQGAATIYETDDDNAPMDCWILREKACASVAIKGTGWYNVYRDFSDENIWPRGLPLKHIRDRVGFIKETEPTISEAPLQQGLANGSPDVDAVWRLILDQDIRFNDSQSIRLGHGLWCPFNSQSTWWWKEAFPLMYLPYYCPFRMTDIWRSFIAQRCLWELGFQLVFHKAEVVQERNPHDPIADFEDEIPGYLRNDQIRKVLETLKLESGSDKASRNLLRCYEALVQINLLPAKELELVNAWIADIESIKL